MKRGQPTANYKCTVTVAKIAKQYTTQRGLCYYSNMPLARQGHWKMSLERLRPADRSYSDGDWVLICKSLNATDCSAKAEDAAEAAAGNLGWNAEKLAHARRCYAERAKAC